MKIVFAAGGSGGHFYPALSTAGELRRSGSGNEIVFFGRRRSPEERLAKKKGYRFFPVPCAPLPERFNLQMFPFLIKSVIGIISSFYSLLKLRPDAVTGFGGYVSAPVVVSAAILNIPVLVHEQNLVPGRANRILFRFADVVALSFPESRKFLKPETRAVVTGNPVRRGIAGGDREGSLRELRLDPGRFTVLVVGGSRGAAVLNRAVVDAFSTLGKEDGNRFQVIHLTGEGERGEVEKGYRLAGIECRVFSYLEDMSPVYGGCDLVVSRSGAGAIAEITSRGIPAVLVPYRYAGGHQSENARYFERAGAGVVLEEKDLSGGALTDFIKKSGLKTDEYYSMSRSSRNLGRPEAAEILAGEIGNLAKSGRGKG